MSKLVYGSLLNRIKAVFIDAIVLGGLGLLATFVLSKFDNPPDYARAIAFLFVFVLYDPLFTSFTGGTIGHHFIGIKVRRDKDPDKKIIFPLALIRFIIKAIFGWVSLLTVTGNSQKKALHDIVAGSVVLKA